MAEVPRDRAADGAEDRADPAENPAVAQVGATPPDPVVAVQANRDAGAGQM